MLGFVSEGAFNAAASLTKPRGLILCLIISGAKVLLL